MIKRMAEFLRGIRRGHDEQRARRIQDLDERMKNKLTRISGTLTDLLELQRDMARKHCAIEGGRCRYDCIHFYGGKVIEFDGRIYIYKPKCKLWDFRY